MSTIRLVISDVDGTLVRGDKSLSDGVVAAVARLQAAGIGFSLISARPPSGLLWIAERLKLTGKIGAFNGGTIVDPDGAIVSADHVAPDDAAAALRLIDRPGIDPWLFRDGRWHARTLEGVHVDHERKAAGIEPVLTSDFSALLDRVDKVVGVCDDHGLLERLEPDVKAALGDRATVARSQAYYLDVTAARGNKGDGVQALAEAAGIPLSAVCVFGDQYNDLPMFARAGLSVAMGQGPEAVRSAATHVVGSNDDDGVAQAIDKFVLSVAK